MAISGCPHLRAVNFAVGGSANPVCGVPDYRARVFMALPTLVSLDGTGIHGQAVHVDVPVPGMGATYYSRHAQLQGGAGEAGDICSEMSQAAEASGQQRRPQQRQQMTTAGAQRKQQPPKQYRDSGPSSPPPAVVTPKIDRALQQHRRRMHDLGGHATDQQQEGVHPPADGRLAAMEQQLLRLARRLDLGGNADELLSSPKMSPPRWQQRYPGSHQRGQERCSSPGRGSRQPPPTRIPVPTARPTHAHEAGGEGPQLAFDTEDEWEEAVGAEERAPASTWHKSFRDSLEFAGQHTAASVCVDAQFNPLLLCAARECPVSHAHSRTAILTQLPPPFQPLFLPSPPLLSSSSSPPPLRLSTRPGGTWQEWQEWQATVSPPPPPPPVETRLGHELTEERRRRIDAEGVAKQVCAPARAFVHQ